jgi:hypothetical protein
MGQILEVIRHLHLTQINPLVGVVVAALLAALIEQRLARQRTPDFSSAYRDIVGRPDKPPARS